MISSFSSCAFSVTTKPLLLFPDIVILFIYLLTASNTHSPFIFSVSQSVLNILFRNFPTIFFPYNIQSYIIHSLALSIVNSFGTPCSSEAQLFEALVKIVSLWASKAPFSTKYIMKNMTESRKAELWSARVTVPDQWQSGSLTLGENQFRHVSYLSWPSAFIRYIIAAFESCSSTVFAIEISWGPCITVDHTCSFLLRAIVDEKRGCRMELCVDRLLGIALCTCALFA